MTRLICILFQTDTRESTHKLSQEREYLLLKKIIFQEQLDKCIIQLHSKGGGGGGGGEIKISLLKLEE